MPTEDRLVPTDDRLVQAEDQRLRFVDSRSTKVLRWGLIVVGAVLIGAVLLDHDRWSITTKETVGKSTTESSPTLVIALLALGAGFIAVGALLNRIREVSLPGGIAFKLGDDWTSDAEAAARQTGTKEAPDKDATEAGRTEDEDTEAKPETLLDLRLRLEYKLTWIAKHFGASVTEPVGYLTIGSLKQDHYMTHEQARTATRILTASELELDLPSSTSRETFLTASRTLVSNVRANAVFERAKHDLNSLARKPGWASSEINWRSGRRADLLLIRPEKVPLRIATVFPYGKDDAYTEARSRLAAAGDKMEGWIVIPRKLPRQIDLEPLNAGQAVPIVYLDELKAKLATDAVPPSGGA